MQTPWGLVEILGADRRLEMAMEPGCQKEGRVKSILPRSRSQGNPERTTGLQKDLRAKGIEKGIVYTGQLEFLETVRGFGGVVLCCRI